MSAIVTMKTKYPTPLSTRALAAFLTWKQFDALLLLRVAPSTSSFLAAQMAEIHAYDLQHGGAFYNSTKTASVYSTLRTLERRGMVARWHNERGQIEWAITERGYKSIDWLDENI